MKSVKPLLAAAALMAGITCLGTGQAQAVTPHTTYCKVVTAQSLTLFNSPGGGGSTYYFTTNARFLTDRTDAPYNRYHVVLSPYSPEGWVSSDPAYTNPCP